MHYPSVYTPSFNTQSRKAHNMPMFSLLILALHCTCEADSHSAKPGSKYITVVKGQNSRLLTYSWYILQIFRQFKLFQWLTFHKPPAPSPLSPSRGGGGQGQGHFLLFLRDHHSWIPIMGHQHQGQESPLATSCGSSESLKSQSDRHSSFVPGHNWKCAHSHSPCLFGAVMPPHGTRQDWKGLYVEHLKS